MAYDTDREVMGRRFGLGAATQAEAAQIDVGLRRYMLSVYNYMASGLLLSGIVAVVVANTGLQDLFFQMTEAGRWGYTGLGFVAMLAPIGIILAMSFGAARMGNAGLQGLYWALVATMGIGFAVLLKVYTGDSVARVFFITAAAFGALSLYGYTTKRTLSGFGTFLFMGLIGLVIAMVVNIFMQSAMMQFIISSVGVLVFSGLIAFDTQRLKNEYFEVQGTAMEERSAIMGAVSLYLNFVNLFQFLLSFLGNRE
ncbi:MAG: Bax inhibitor-1/YccA family protein [Rhodospirillaceae bacterium]|nr:Bax inhibitor-1/YccA family protein [Rhodospirillaceae bacterium]